MGFWDFVFGATLLSTLSYVTTTWIKARHGYPLPADDEQDHHRRDRSEKARIELLSKENEGLKGKISKLEDRLLVLERIVTDPAERTAREIESLR